MRALSESDLDDFRGSVGGRLPKGDAANLVDDQQHRSEALELIYETSSLLCRVEAVDPFVCGGEATR
ncbi:MAG: hypothetical protein ACRDK3_00135 [Actinomycetota bacterium]